MGSGRTVMSVLGYFEPPQKELRLLKDKAGFGADGDVLEGKKSVESARALQAARAAQLPTPVLEWIQVEDYDPVLRAHCRLDREG